jgi:hypothetical protein
VRLDVERKLAWGAGYRCTGHQVVEDRWRTIREVGIAKGIDLSPREDEIGVVLAKLPRIASLLLTA